MRRTLSVFVLAASVAVGTPTEAQDNLITVGHFATIAVADVPAFEEAAREHAQWHGSQNDPTPWPTYQALTGHGEYAFLMSNGPWSSLDNPAISPADDVEHWAASGGEYTQTLETTIWTAIPGGNPPADPTALAGALRDLLSGSGEARRAMGAFGRRRIERDFSIQEIAARYAELYHELRDAPLLPADALG